MAIKIIKQIKKIREMLFKSLEQDEAEAKLFLDIGKLTGGVLGRLTRNGAPAP